MKKSKKLKAANYNVTFFVARIFIKAFVKNGKLSLLSF